MDEGEEEGRGGNGLSAAVPCQESPQNDTSKEEFLGDRGDQDQGKHRGYARLGELLKHIDDERGRGGQVPKQVVGLGGDDGKPQDKEEQGQEQDGRKSGQGEYLAKAGPGPVKGPCDQDGERDGIAHAGDGG